MKKHLSKNELLQQMKYVSKMRSKATSAPFTTMSVLSNWTLWKTEGWGNIRLADYNQRVADYYAEEYDMTALSDRLMQKADFSVEVKYHTYDDNCYKKSKKYRHTMEQKLMEADDEINRCSQKYLLIHFNVLMDMGYGKIRLNRVKDAMNENLNQYRSDIDISVMDWRRELVEKVGIYIEMPA